MTPNPIVNMQQTSARCLGRRGAAGKRLDLGPSGVAFFPKGQTHAIACVSKDPCTWYLLWDAKP